MKSKFLTLMLVVALALVFAAPAVAAGPVITDLTSPTHPDQYGFFYSNDPEFTWSASPGPYGWCDTPGQAYAVDVAGGIACVADDNGDALRVIDASDPAELSARGAYGYLGGAREVDVVGSIAYVASWWDPTGLAAIDVGDPDAPELLGTFGTGDWGMDVKVVGSYAYVPADYAGFYVIDVSDPASMHQEGWCTVGTNAHGVDIAGDYAFVAWDGYGLVVVDVTDPAAPSPVMQLYLDGRDAEQVAVAGDRAYVTASGDLVVIDITDPEAPSTLGVLETPGQAYGVAVDGTTVYVGDGDAGVQVVDVSDPADPSITKTLDTLGYARGITLAGGLIYVGDGWNGLVVLDPNTDTLPGEFSYSYCIDETSDTVADESVEGTTAAAGFTDLADGTWWFHVRAVDGDGVWGPTAHYQVNIDHRPLITSLWSPTHWWGEWTANNDPQFAWASSVPCDAFSYALDQVDGSEPDEAPDPVADLESPSVTLTDVPDGSWWFHVRARDLEGNWGPSQQYYISIKTLGPVTMAVSAKSAKKATIVLQYSVHDFVGWGAAVNVAIKNAGGTTIQTIDCGWRDFDRVYAVAVTTPLKRGRYTYTVHATDWLGNPEREAGTAGFTIR